MKLSFQVYAFKIKLFIKRVREYYIPIHVTLLFETNMCIVLIISISNKLLTFCFNIEIHEYMIKNIFYQLTMIVTVNCLNSLSLQDANSEILSG